MSKTAFTISLKKSNPHDLVRHTWGFSPAERIVESKKKYNRQAGKLEVRRQLREE